MYVHRILLRDVRNFEAWDATLLDPWTEKPLDSVLLKGLNGSGKTTILKVIAALWENLGGWLQFGKALNATQQAQNSFLTQFNLAALEIRAWQAQPVWLFVAATPGHHQMLQEATNDPNAAFIGEVRGGKGRPNLDMRNAPWLDELRRKKDRLELGVGDRGESLPNLVFLEAETRSILNPKGKPTRQMPESLYQWLVTYEGHDRWEGHIETMLRNLKLRNPQAFRDTLSDISNVLGRDKRLTDFDDNLRLRVQIGARKAHSHTLDELSAGERQCLILLFMASRWLMPGGILLIDEPDLHLHVSLQRQLIHELKSLVHARQGQLIVSSHSPVMWEEYSSAQTITLDQIAHEQT